MLEQYEDAAGTRARGSSIHFSLAREISISSFERQSPENAAAQDSAERLKHGNHVHVYKIYNIYADVT